MFDSHLNLKLADFGLSIRDKPLCEDFVGTEKYYMAPEIIQKQKFDPFKADVFSLAQIFFMIITKKVLFDKACYEDKKYNLLVTKPALFWKFFQEAYPDIKLEKSFIFLIQKMVNPEPKKRFDIEQVLDSEWLSQKID